MHVMNRDDNPYSAPSHASSVYGDAIKNFFGRSIVAGLLAVATFGTGLCTFWLGTNGVIDLGRFGMVALISLMLATIALLAAVRFYSIGWRPCAVGSLVLAILCLTPIVLIAFDAVGVFKLF